MTTSRLPFAVLFACMLTLSFPLAWLAFTLYGSYQISQFQIYEGLASLLFWSSIVGLVFLFPMRYLVPLFSKYIKSVRGVSIFASYISVHLILYGFILEGIVAYSFKIPSTITQPQAFVNSVALTPINVISILAGFSFNPAVDLYIPPVYVMALSFYTISMSFIIAVLVLTNVLKVMEIGKTCNTAFKSRSLIILPALGVIGGAACCLSLPVLVSLAAPTTALFSDNPIVFYTAYFVFPVATAIGLKYNMDSTVRIALKVSRIVVPNNSTEQKSSAASLSV
jgi:hypothetical protein